MFLSTYVNHREKSKAGLQPDLYKYIALEVIKEFCEIHGISVSAMLWLGLNSFLCFVRVQIRECRPYQS